MEVNAKGPIQLLSALTEATMKVEL
uniref:Uncharacterized protein n=1 Tax=Moniliophthora roreri TaxID=221103 RepID=A0A0W0FEN3_MONRR